MFDIARKIVIFKDGTYGVRRWTLNGYQFLSFKSLGWVKPQWSFEGRIPSALTGDRMEANVALHEYIEKHTKTRYDCGTSS